MSDRISPICGTFLGEPQACHVETVAAVEAGARHFTEHAAGTSSSPTGAVVALVLVLGVACVVMSMPTRRNGRRVTYRKGHR